VGGGRIRSRFREVLVWGHTEKWLAVADSPSSILIRERKGRSRKEGKEVRFRKKAAARGSLVKEKGQPGQQSGAGKDVRKKERKGSSARGKDLRSTHRGRALLAAKNRRAGVRQNDRGVAPEGRKKKGSAHSAARLLGDGARQRGGGDEVSALAERGLSSAQKKG